jgi:hypothetical protein
MPMSKRRGSPPDLQRSKKQYAYLGRAVLVRPTKRLGRNGAKKMSASGIRQHGASEVKQHSDCISHNVSTLSETKKLTGEPHLPRRQ